MTATVLAFSHPNQFEPLLAQADLASLDQVARVITEKAFRLQGGLAVETRDALRALIRQMDAYYSSRLEDQETHPQNIFRAVGGEFSDSAEVAKRQRIALAHLNAEHDLEASLPATQALGAALQSRFLVQAHSAFYASMTIEDRTTTGGRVIGPGRMRQEDVSMGRYMPPAACALSSLFDRMDGVYPKVQGLERLVSTIAAHHYQTTRMRPFVDGTGRACRLQTLCALLPYSGGLWTITRGLARHQDRYDEFLEGDGRGQEALAVRGERPEKALYQWCEFFLQILNEEVCFMSEMLDLGRIKKSLAELMVIRVQSGEYPHHSSRATVALHHVVGFGAVSRRDFVQLLGLPELSAQRVIGALLNEGLLVSSIPEGPLSIGFSLDSLHFLFPGLWPEAAHANIEF